jgi:hypothetical protein
MNDEFERIWGGGYLNVIEVVSRNLPVGTREKVKKKLFRIAGVPPEIRTITAPLSRPNLGIVKNINSDN